MGVDDGGHGIGGVVKSVDELEAKGDQQSQSKKKIWPDPGDGYGVQISCDVKDDVAEPAGQCQQEQHKSGFAG